MSVSQWIADMKGFKEAVRQHGQQKRKAETVEQPERNQGKQEQEAPESREEEEESLSDGEISKPVQQEREDDGEEGDQEEEVSSSDSEEGEGDSKKSMSWLHRSDLIPYDEKSWFTLINVGKPGSGKTELTRRLIVEKLTDGTCDFCIVISGSNTNDYTFLPQDKVIFTGWDSYKESLWKFLYAHRTNSENPIKLLVVIEDPLGSFPWKDPLFIKLVTTNRQVGPCSYIINTQYINAAPTVVRECEEYAAIFYQQSAQAVEGIWKSKRGQFGKVQEFHKALIENCGPQNPDNKYAFMWFNPKNGEWERVKLAKMEMPDDFEFEY